MNREELLVEIERHGGKIEPIKQVCQFETFGKSIFDLYSAKRFTLLG